MSQPNSVGAVAQLLLGVDYNPVEKLGWYCFQVKNPDCGKAGRWCIASLQGEWTFTNEPFGKINFYIRDASDAMLFKLAWGGKL